MEIRDQERRGTVEFHRVFVPHNVKTFFVIFWRNNR